MNTIAFIPARCGSKAIHLKNIKPFYGRPLLYWTAQALQECQSVDQVVVATDCQDVKQCIESFKLSKLQVFLRDPNNAQDSSATEDVMLEYINQSALSDHDQFMLVQATSPFTTAAQFDEALAQFEASGKQSLLSCARVKRFFWSPQGSPVNYDHKNRPRRQDFEGSLMENGAFYINSVAQIKSHGNRLSEPIDIYEMPAYTALELDEDEDWAQGELLMHRYHTDRRQSIDVKLFLSDVDGVLTDAGMYYTENGDELKKFNTYDGMGFKILQAKGAKVGILTKEDRQLNRNRAKKLKLDFDFHGVDHKLELVQDLCQKEGIQLHQVAYIGDDVNDEALLRAVGVAACPASARSEIKSIPGINILKTSGGQGPVREFVEEILLG